MKILLVCNAGMSTGIMRIKLEEEAEKRGLNATVNAVPMSTLDDNAEGADIILLGPQIRFALKDIQNSYGNKAAVMVIKPQDFGQMKAAKVLDEALALLD